MRRPWCALVLAAALAGACAAPAQEPAAPAFRWQDLERRNAGIVVFRSRWDKGSLELKDDLVRWADRRDSGKNLVLPVQRLLGHTLVCKGPAPAPCSEWRISTKTDTYVFRETPPGTGAELRRAFDALRAAYAGLPAEESR